MAMIEISSNSCTKIYFLLIAFCLVSFYSLSQNQEAPKGIGRLTGIVIDSLSKAPVEFANVVILDPATGKPIDGAVCDEKGKFVITKIPKGKFIVMISFIGYDSKKVGVEITDSKSSIEMGAIKL